MPKGPLSASHSSSSVLWLSSIALLKIDCKCLSFMHYAWFRDTTTSSNLWMRCGWVCWKFDCWDYSKLSIVFTKKKLHKGELVMLETMLVSSWLLLAKLVYISYMTRHVSSFIVNYWLMISWFMFTIMAIFKIPWNPLAWERYEPRL